jgi:hypothetical protein
MTTAADDREQRIRELSEKLRLVHARYMARYAELRSRQTALLKDVLTRLDSEQAAKILSAINGGNEKN